uniref:ZP domain-containing protein n=1 Tax=Dracunculus medinensis TaxID=318479 RepID=A0A0N4US69_DRAME
LPDRESIYFSCQIKLCFKNGGYCTDLTPPKCEEIIQNIEDDLRDDQLIATTSGLPVTSRTVKVLTSGRNPRTTSPAILLLQNEKKNDIIVPPARSGAENNVESAASPVLKPQYKVLKSTRDRRTATDENDNIIDVDVTSSKVKIIEQEFEYPEQSLQLQTFNNIRYDRDSICVPLYGIWILLGLCAISVAMASAASYRARTTSRKFVPFCQ